MAGWAEGSASSRGGAVAAVAIVLALVGWAVWKAPERGGLVTAEAPASDAAAAAEGEASAEAAPAAETAEPAAETAAAPSDETAAAPADEVTAETAAPEVAVTAAPTIDVLRVAPDGTTTLAGRSGPGDAISVLVDGAEVATAPADGAGQFATIFTLEPAATARVLSLLARAPDGSVTAGAEEVAIAPMPVPEPAAVAEAAPEPAPADSAAAASEPVAETAQEPALADSAAATSEPLAEAGAGSETVDATTAEASVEAGAEAAGVASEDAGTASSADAAAPAPEPEAPAAILITEDGAEVLQAPGEAAPVAALALEVISYGADGAVQLGGTGAAGATLRFYLDNAEVASTIVAGDGGWSLNNAEIAPGIYTLRIDQLDAGGAVTSRIETPFKRETLEALAAAAETAPAPEAAPEATAAPASTVQTAESPAQPEAPAGEAATAALPEPDTGTAGAASAEATAQPGGADAAPAASAPPITVTVQPGYTLWAIARKNLGRGILYVLVFEANRDQIRDPDLIYPGQVLSLPASP